MVAMYLIFAFFAPLAGELPLQTALRFPNRVFVETGSYEGAGIEVALRAGFKEIFSIELSPHLYEACRERFKGRKEVRLILGDSGERLKEVLAGLNEPATFWLDGHYSGGATAKGGANCPLLEELRAIQAHRIKTHTILIDDVRLFGSEEFDFLSKREVLGVLLQINPAYQISYAHGTFARDILVALPPKNLLEFLPDR